MENSTTINWETDSVNVVRTKRELSEFLKEQSETEKGKYPKIDAYHERRILELTTYIQNHAIPSVTIENQGRKWTFDNMTFEQGIQKAHYLNGYMGLIGRIYIFCSDGREDWIKA